MTDEQKSQAQREAEAEIKQRELDQRLATIELAISGIARYLQSSPEAKRQMELSFDSGMYLGGGVLNGIIKANARKLLNL